MQMMQVGNSHARISTSQNLHKRHKSLVKKRVDLDIIYKLDRLFLNHDHCVSLSRLFAVFCRLFVNPVSQQGNNSEHDPQSLGREGLH